MSELPRIVDRPPYYPHAARIGNSPPAVTARPVWGLLSPVAESVRSPTTTLDGPDRMRRAGRASRRGARVLPRVCGEDSPKQVAVLEMITSAAHPSR